MKSIELTWQTGLQVDFSELDEEGGYASVTMTDDSGEDVEIVAEDRAGLRKVLTEMLAAIPEDSA